MPKSCTACAERALPDDAAFCFRWVDHVTVHRWVQRFTSLPADAARFARHSPRETYVKVNGVWRYVYRAVDQHGQVIDVLLSARRDVVRLAGSSPGHSGP
jgi:transposase-like protein